MVKVRQIDGLPVFKTTAIQVTIGSVHPIFTASSAWPLVAAIKDNIPISTVVVCCFILFARKEQTYTKDIKYITI
jgi:hypothetical protein